MITVIATVLNEGDTIYHLLNGLLDQSKQADEIIIVDGGSHDKTLDVLRQYESRLPLRIFIENGCNISQGRNRAIREAQGTILAITDAGVRLTPTWLEKITAPLLTNPQVSVACGFFQADPQTTFEAAMGATVLPLADEINPETFLPSSRSVAVRKSAVDAIKGYPEWLDYCEDLVFDLRLKASGASFVFVPDALVYFRPRGSFKSFFKQYYRYARGDGKADLWRKRHAIRYLTYFVAAPLISLLGFFVHPLLWGLFLLGAVYYCYQPYRRLPIVMQTAPEKNLVAWLQVLVLVPMIRVVGDFAKMLGYPVGWRWRFEQHPPDWHWQA